MVGFQIFNMENFNNSLAKLEDLIRKKASHGDADLLAENKKLQQELQESHEKYTNLVQTSEEIVKELNKSIQVIDKFFEKQNANNKNI